jgi:Mg-chelatase subunit ChlD
MRTRGFWLNVFILLLGSSVFLAGSGLPVRAQAAGPGEALACRPATVPDTHSLLVVLLDRSASLARTDPQEYSTSVTRVLADLWPGRMAVLFFRGTSPHLPQLGPLDLTRPGARAALQTQIEAQRNVLGGDTPTQYAVEQAAGVLVQNGYPAGSRVMLITDGQPFLPTDQDGTRQIATIEQQDMPAFCSHGVPVHTFGLGNQVPGYALAFLQRIATQTAGDYHEVTDPAQLAAPVLQMYASWQHLAFASTGASHQFLVDTYARQVYFIVFLKDSTAFPVALLGPDQHPVPAQNLQNQAQDIHYQFDQMVVQRFNTAGIYTIETGDPGAQTYALEETRLQVTLVSPTAHTPLYAGRPLTVAVALYDNDNPQQHIHPTSSESVTIGLTYTLRSGGKTLVSGEKKLVQQPAPNDDVFSTQIVLPRTGALTLAISASYQYIAVPNTPEVTLQVLTAPPALCPGGFACGSGPGGLPILLLVALILVLVLAGLLFWRLPRPSGVLETSRGQSRELGRARAWTKRVLAPSTLFSEELSEFDFQQARFRLLFKRGRRVLLVAMQNAPSLAVWCMQEPAGRQMQPVKVGTPVPLHTRDRIVVNGVPSATFRQDQPPSSQAGTESAASPGESGQETPGPGSSGR